LVISVLEEFDDETDVSDEDSSDESDSDEWWPVNYKDNLFTCYWHILT
jgi:hypothetical protein